MQSPWFLSLENALSAVPALIPRPCRSLLGGFVVMAALIGTFTPERSEAQMSIAAEVERAYDRYDQAASQLHNAEANLATVRNRAAELHPALIEATARRELRQSQEVAAEERASSAEEALVDARRDARLRVDEATSAHKDDQWWWELERSALFATLIAGGLLAIGIALSPRVPRTDGRGGLDHAPLGWWLAAGIITLGGGVGLVLGLRNITGAVAAGVLAGLALGWVAALITARREFSVSVTSAIAGLTGAVVLALTFLTVPGATDDPEAPTFEPHTLQLAAAAEDGLYDGYPSRVKRLDSRADAAEASADRAEQTEELLSQAATQLLRTARRASRAVAARKKDLRYWEGEVSYVESTLLPLLEAPAPPTYDTYDSYDSYDSPYPDLDCDDFSSPQSVYGADPNGLDGDGDGVGCEGS